MGDRLDEYRRKRDATRTPEPVPARPATGGRRSPPAEKGRRRVRRVEARFVIQQHHARRLHWDLRLKRDGVLVSWAVPRGLPRDQSRNHLAVHTEDHPLEYLDFHGEIPAGEYGAGQMTIFDTGTYEAEKWRDDEVVVVLRGNRVSGRYVLFATRGKDWMIRRMDPPPPGWTSMPGLVRPMRATPARALPADDEAWGYEMRWDGRRAVAYVSAGRLRLLSADDEDITATYPGLRELAETMAPIEAVLDGEVVIVDARGRVRPAPPASKRPPAGSTVQYLVFDLLWLEGTSSVDLPYAQRRDLLEGLALAGPHWQTPPRFTGGGAFAVAAGREQGLAGVVAKRLGSPYVPGRRTRTWLSIDT